LEIFYDLKLVRCPRSLAPTLVTLPSMSFIPFTPFSGDDIGIGKIGAVLKAFVFKPEPSRWEASETDGQAERPTERERRSQQVEVELENQASSLATLRVALGYFFVGESLEARGLSSFVALTFQDRTIFPRARRMVAAIFCSSITARTFSGNGRRASACRRCSFAANILSISTFTPSTASICPQADAASTRQQGSSDRALPVRAKFGRARGPWCVPFAARWRLSVRLAARELAHLHT